SRARSTCRMGTSHSARPARMAATSNTMSRMPGRDRGRALTGDEDATPLLWHWHLVRDLARGVVLLQGAAIVEELDVGQRFRHRQTPLEPRQIVPRPGTPPAHPRRDGVAAQRSTGLLGDQGQDLIQSTLVMGKELARPLR